MTDAAGPLALVVLLLSAVARPLVAPGSRGQPPPVGATSTRSSAAADGGAAVPSPPSTGDELLVGTKDGLEIWSRNGQKQGLLSPGEARHPRWVDADTIAVLESGGRPLGDGFAVELVDARDGRRRRAARVPAFHCAAGGNSNGPSEPLDLQDEADFVVDRARGRVCVELLDRNINMASVSVDMTIALDTGRVSRWLALGQEECTPPKGTHAKERPAAAGCTAPQRPSVGRPLSDTFPFTVKPVDGAVDVVGGVEGPVRVANYEEGDISPSGRWQLLHGEQEDGDYIHFKQLLLDRETGALFPLGTPGRWPRALKVSAHGKQRRIKTPVEHTAEVVGETPVRWVGPAVTEVLLVGRVLYVPGEKSFAVGGELIGEARPATANRP